MIEHIHFLKFNKMVLIVYKIDIRKIKSYEHIDVYKELNYAVTGVWNLNGNDGNETSAQSL